MMKEHPVLFSGEMVRAILDGRKTQTRRPVKPQPTLCREPVVKNGEPGRLYVCPDLLPTSDECGYVFVECECPGTYHHMGIEALVEKRSPFGVPGDRLWVRETWQPCRNGDTNETVAVYRADWEANGSPQGPVGGKWRPSIRMPRWASRITLEVTAVRVERVQDISVADCWTEAVNTVGYTKLTHNQLRNGFAVGWDAIYATKGYGWDENPWVFACEFRRIEPEWPTS
jgi:hypothetical protein